MTIINNGIVDGSSLSEEQQATIDTLTGSSGRYVGYTLVEPGTDLPTTTPDGGELKENDFILLKYSAAWADEGKQPKSTFAVWDGTNWIYTPIADKDTDILFLGAFDSTLPSNININGTEHPIKYDTCYLYQNADESLNGFYMYTGNSWLHQYNPSISSAQADILSQLGIDNTTGELTLNGTVVDTIVNITQTNTPLSIMDGAMFFNIEMLPTLTVSGIDDSGGPTIPR